ncbi:MAG: putative phospholipid ABC transporter permease protein MlaE [Phycisphaerae bacterium]|nr:putative phospholipid ABC transporter permease protein MlaE [Phycisphaerae bacterium]
MSESAGRKLGVVARLGSALLGLFRYIGGMGWLLADTVRLAARGLFVPGVKIGRPALAAQMIRVGVRSLGIVMLVHLFIGIILALQMAPVLRDFEMVDRVATIVAIAQVRELGPLITAIVLSGFAGAAIAAELGTMVVGEEIEALRAQALDPVRFLVVPRVLATVVMTVCLTVLADLVGMFGAYLTGAGALGISTSVFYHTSVDALTVRSFLTGLTKAGMFGLLISVIACFEGLRVGGGAEGVGRATTRTVVYSIFSLILADCVFTILFYAYDL